MLIFIVSQKTPKFSILCPNKTATALAETFIFGVFLRRDCSIFPPPKNSEKTDWEPRNRNSGEGNPELGKEYQGTEYRRTREQGNGVQGNRV